MISNEPKTGQLSSNAEINGVMIWDKGEAKKRSFFLKNKLIGISISESEDLELHGYSVEHLQDLLIEMSRYILSVGGGLVYGGDLRNGGFTTTLCDMVEVYKDFENASDKRFINYLAWPLSMELTKEHILRYKNRVTFVPVPPPGHLAIENEQKFLYPNTLDNQIIWADCLSAMRQEMEQKCYGRILAGGRVSGFTGKLPGLLEELMEAIKSDKPVYLLGAFGGITKRITEFLKGGKASIFDPTQNYLEFIEHYGFKRTGGVDLKALAEQLKDYGLKRIIENSGLTKEEYFSLMENRNITTNIYLILKGLSVRGLNA